MDPVRSDALVFFGATGDLAHKKVFPALQAMLKRGHLNVDGAAFDKLSSLLSYVDGDYQEPATFDPVSCTEVLVEFKSPPCAAFGEKMERPNYVRFRLGPDVAIALGVRSKAPGEAMVGQELELVATRGIEVEMAAYERLLGDAMKGDATLFAREDAVEAEWRIVAPILTSTTPPHEYQPGSWGPVEADRLIDRPGGWAKPFATRTEP